MAVCVISGTILNLDGTPNTDVAIIARAENGGDYGGQVNVTAGVGVTSEMVQAFTDDDGDFEITLLQGARVLLEIESINLRKMIDVPLDDTASFLDLI